HRNPDGTNFANGRRNQTENNIEIVDHEVQHNIDIEASWRECSQAMDLEELGLRRKLASCSDNRIESFNMTDLKDTLMSHSSVDQNLGLFNRRSDRFFDKHVDTVFEEIDSDARVLHRRDCETGGIDLAEQFVIIDVRSCVVEFRNFVRPC